MKETLTIVKVGGAVVEDEQQLARLLDDFARIEGRKLLVHGGGRRATRVATALGIESRMVNGRRITDEKMLEVVTMVYGGLVNKHIVALLQAHEINALGLTGADMNVILSHRRPPVAVSSPQEGIEEGQTVDFGFVGDVERVDAQKLSLLIEAGITPVVSPLTHDGKGPGRTLRRAPGLLLREEGRAEQPRRRGQRDSNHQPRRLRPLRSRRHDSRRNDSQD